MSDPQLQPETTEAWLHQPKTAVTSMAMPLTETAFLVVLEVLVAAASETPTSLRIVVWPVKLDFSRHRKSFFLMVVKI